MRSGRVCEGMPEFRAAAGSSRCSAVGGACHPGLLALRSASGLGAPRDDAGTPAPTAFNRAGEKAPGDRGRAAQGYLRGWSPTAVRARSLLIWEEGLGTRSGVEGGG